MSPATDVVVRYDVALMDPYNRQLQCLIPGVLGFGKIALHAERARFAIPVRDIWLRLCSDRPPQWWLRPDGSSNHCT